MTISDFLCKIGFHKWRFRGPNALATGAYDECERCGMLRYIDFVSGGTIYHKPADGPKEAA